MPRTVQLLSASNFSPGLRLDVDAFQLGEGESPDLLNVDLDPRGGVAMRRAVTAINSSSAPLTSPIHSMFEFAKTDGTEQVLVGAGKYTYYTTGSSFTSIGTTWTVADRQRSVAFRDALYIQNGTDAPRKWTGSAVSTLTDPAVGPTYNDNLASPNDGDMPKAKTICAWQGYVWVGNLLENVTAQKNRIRFSHPNRAEDWRTSDYIDIDVGHDGDQITALIPLSDRLLVFKNHSLHMITGYDPDTFAVSFVANVGAPSQEAVVATEYGVYFFSWPTGLHFYGERGVNYAFDALYPAIRDGDIPDAYHAETTVGWLGRRVFVSVPWSNSTKNDRTFVLTPGKGAGWTQYDLGLGPMLEWRRTATDSQQLAATSGSTDSVRVLRLDQAADTDTWYTDHLALTGASGSYASAPDTAGLSLTGDLEIRAIVSLDDWTPSTQATVVSKYNASSNSGYELVVTTGGNLAFTYGTGASSATRTSTVATGLTDGTKTHVRVTVDVNNGAAGHEVKFYLSYDGTTWTQLGSTVTTAGTIAIGDNASALTVGARAGDQSNRLVGKLYRATVYSDITATTAVASPDFTAQSGSSVTSFNDTQANTWTINSPAALSAQDPNIASYYMTRWFDAGSPAVVKRWRRPDIVYDADYEALLRVGVYRDYEPTAELKYFEEEILAEGSGGVWGSFDWGDGTVWGASDTGAQTVERGALLGRGRAVALKFTGPTPSKRWSVNSINFKYIPRRVR